MISHRRPVGAGRSLWPEGNTTRWFGLARPRGRRGHDGITPCRLSGAGYLRLCLVFRLRSFRIHCHNRLRFRQVREAHHAVPPLLVAVAPCAFAPSLPRRHSQAKQDEAAKHHRRHGADNLGVLQGDESACCMCREQADEQVDGRLGRGHTSSQHTHTPGLANAPGTGPHCKVSCACTTMG